MTGSGDRASDGGLGPADDGPGDDGPGPGDSDGGLGPADDGPADDGPGDSDGGLALADGVGRVVVLDVVGLRPEHLSPERTPALSRLLGGEAPTAPLRPAFPALTVPAQTTLATGQPPRVHGDVASGEYDRATDSVAFWERDRGDRDRLWEAASDDAGLTTGALFFQHLIGTTADVAVTPSPIEDEDDNLLEMDCWTNPDGLYDDLVAEYGHFPLHSYWGPGASAESTRWILDAAREAVGRVVPDLLWVYVPHLDYAGLRSGPHSVEFEDALGTVDGMVGEFLTALRGDDRWNVTAVNVVSEYGFHAVETPILPNRALRAAGLLETDAGGDVDLSASTAFAMVDHQVAHVYVSGGVREAAEGDVADAGGDAPDAEGDAVDAGGRSHDAGGDALDAARDVLEPLRGVEAVLGDRGKAARGVDHPNAGDLVLVADADAWFQYYWWDDPGAAPGYATDMDIHAKPGFDPCELFVGDEGLVSLDPSKVGGSHGRVDEPGWGFYGLGGPAAPAGTLDGPVDATRVAPTAAELLGVRDDVAMAFETGPLVRTG